MKWNSCGRCVRTWRAVRIALLFAVMNLCSATDAATVTKITLPKKTITVFGVDVGFRNSGMTTEKVIPQPDIQRIGVLLGDTIGFKGVLTPPITIADSRFSWSGVQLGSGQTISATITRVGPNSQTLSVGGKEKTAVSVAFDVQPPNEDQWAFVHPVAALYIYFSLQSSAFDWAASANSTYSWGDSQLHNGKADAARHAYWNVLMAMSSIVGPDLALQAGYAHERTNLEEVSNPPHNETAMDLTNNWAGISIAASLPSNASETQQQSAVVNAINAGSLVILDDLTNSSPYPGLLQPSNK